MSYTRVCCRCGTEKPREAFNADRSRKDGLSSCCKPCNVQRVREWRHANPDLWQEYQSRNAPRIARQAQSYRERHPERVVESQRRYHKTHAAEMWQKARHRHEADPRKRRARQAVMNALRANELVRPGSCSACGKHTKLQAHHEDYDKPLDVQWLCAGCHGQRHFTRHPLTEVIV